MRLEQNESASSTHVHAYVARSRNSPRAACVTPAACSRSVRAASTLNTLRVSTPNKLLISLYLLSYSLLAFSSLHFVSFMYTHAKYLSTLVRARMRGRPLSAKRGRPLSAERGRPLSDERGRPLSDERGRPLSRAKR